MFLAFAAFFSICLIYFPAITAPFYLKDFDITVNNLLLSQSLSFEVLYKFLAEGQLSFVSFYLTNGVLGFEPENFRTVNLFLHLMVTGAVFGVCNTLLKHCNHEKFMQSRQSVAWMASLLFLLLPLNSQSVIYIAERAVLLNALFYLTGLFAYLHFCQSLHSAKKALWLLLTIFCFVLGVFNSANMLTFPLALLLVEALFLQRFKWLKVSNVALVLVITFFGFMFVDFVFSLSAAQGINETLLQTTYYSRWQYFSHQLVQFWLYLYKFWIPAPLLLEYPITSYTWSDDITWFAAFGHVALIFAGFKLRKRNPLLSLLIALLYLINAVESSFILILPDLALEHRTYMANAVVSIGFCFALMTILPINKKVLAVLFGAVLVVFAVLTHKRAEQWSNKLVFLKHELRHTIDKSRLYGAVAVHFAETEKIPTAKTWAKMTLQVAKEHGHISPSVIVRYMNAMFSANEDGEAMRTGVSAMKMVASDKGKAMILKRIAKHKIDGGNCMFAIGMLKRAQGYDPVDTELAELLAFCGKQSQSLPKGVILPSG